MKVGKPYLMVTGTIAPALAALMIGKAVTKQAVWPMKPQCWFIVAVAGIAGFIITKKALENANSN